MQRTRRNATAAWTSMVVGLAVLAGCEIGVEQPLVEERPAISANVSAIPPAEVETSASADAGTWQPARPRNQKFERGKLNFVEGYQAGYQLAAKQSKPMLLFFTAEWCRYCHQMAQEAFTHPQVIALSQSFVCVLVDADSEPAVCRQFGVTGYPTIQFLSPRGVPLERVVGKKPGHQLIMAMRAALQSVAHRDDDEPVAR